MMKYNLIYTDDYVLAVDANADINAGDWYFTPSKDIPCHCTSQERAEELNWHAGTRKIFAHRPLRENVLYLYGVDVLPDFDEVDVEKKVDSLKNNFGYSTDDYYQGAEDGYKQALEDNKEKKYTEEDMINAYNLGSDAGATFQRQVRSGHTDETFDEVAKKRFQELVQSLSQPKMPVGFKCEIEYKDMVGGWYKVDKNTQLVVDRFDCQTRIKTIANSEGRTEWVGRYVY